MKFAIISADSCHKAGFKIDCMQGDCTSFLNWIDVFSGVHLSYDKLREESDISYLKDFDVIMFSGNLHYITDIIRIAEMLKSEDTITIYYPEGSTQLYDNSINGFHKEYYDAWNACDILSSAEEDKIDYYESFVSSDTIVRFIHVPMREELFIPDMFISKEKKERFTVVYGDNNPNHPLTAMACAYRMNMTITPVCISHDHLKSIRAIMPGIDLSIGYPKLAQKYFFSLLGRSMIHFYPTEWIGTARQQVACAIVGTPCIGNKDSHTQKRLFPKLGAYIYDLKAMIEIAKELESNETFYRETADYAHREAWFYSLKNTMTRFMSAVESAKKIKARRRGAVLV